MRLRTAIACVIVLAAVSSGAAPAAAQVGQKLSEVSDTGVHGFSVTLVLGAMQGSATPDNLPQGAKKALADMRDFLPYKSYRLLDTQWILCCGSTKAGTGISGRLRGAGQSREGDDQQMYAFHVTVLGASGRQLSVRFVLNDAAESPAKMPSSKLAEEALLEDGIASLKREQEALEARLAEVRRQLTPQHVQVRELESKIAMQAQKIARARGGAIKGAVIDSTFSMDVGETVVIGTSSLKGDQALIALLTAARRPQQQTSTQGEGR